MYARTVAHRRRRRRLAAAVVRLMVPIVSPHMDRLRDAAIPERCQLFRLAAPCPQCHARVCVVHAFGTEPGEEGR
jgi:hypothetical protein